MQPLLSFLIAMLTKFLTFCTTPIIQANAHTFARSFYNKRANISTSYCMRHSSKLSFPNRWFESPIGNWSGWSKKNVPWPRQVSDLRSRESSECQLRKRLSFGMTLILRWNEAKTDYGKRIRSIRWIIIRDLERQSTVRGLQNRWKWSNPISRRFCLFPLQFLCKST